VGLRSIISSTAGVTALGLVFGLPLAAQEQLPVAELATQQAPLETVAPLPVQAPEQQQAQTLADIRQEMSVLFVEVQRLQRELSTTGAPATALGGGGTLERVDLIEVELMRLTAKIEELDFRVTQVALDGSNQLGDLNFRLCELEPGCDIGALPGLAPLGGVAATLPNVAVEPETGAELAVSERSDFQRAVTTLTEGDPAAARDQLDAFVENYPGGPLTAEAHFWRGESLSQLGETSTAARAYLTSFSDAPNGDKAADALFKLGTSLGALGQLNEACVTLGEVGLRYPGAGVVLEAQSAMLNLGCS
jgi:tol-pal system protein YbgF